MDINSYKYKIEKKFEEVLKEHMTHESIPPEVQAAPGVCEVWKGEFADFQMRDIVKALFDGLGETMRDVSFELLLTVLQKGK